jgi:plastocyanin
MRRALAAALAALALVPASAGSHPGHAPPTVSVAVYAYTPSTLNVVEGDLVQWNWDGPDTGHSVTSDPGSGEKFDSGVIDEQGKSFTYYFAKAGTYAYHCSVHSNMHGTVVVAPGPTIDTTAPVLSNLKLHAGKRKATVRFRITEDASVTTQVLRHGKAVRHAFGFVKAGSAQASFKVAGLAAGRYKVSLVAEDPTGNKSKPAVVGLRR